MSLVGAGLFFALFASAIYGQIPFRPEIPKVWDDAALAEWATPVAGLNVRPKHMSASEYDALKIENLRTYPVYAPGREPEGYWKKLQELGPQPLIDTSELKTQADWISAGKRVFDELDFLHLRTLDPKYINEVRNRTQGGRVLADGTLFGLRWVPTQQGVALTFSNCSFCHTMFLQDGTRVPGAPFRTIAPRPGVTRTGSAVLARVQSEKGVLAGAPPFLMPGEPIGMQLYRAYGVPWRKDDVHEKLKSATEADYEALDLAARQGGITRWNGSLLFPAKVPDLIGIKDRKYIDHTATHLHRGIGDIMRYAALVTSAESAEFGPHQMIGGKAKRSGLRAPDEALYALSLYIYSLQPPPNPNPFGEDAAAGQKLFARECAGCHVPPLYTSNKVTLAEGFELPKNKLASLDVLPISVGTDSGLALRTRKGTGYYKVPSLKGVWYRGRYLHDGSVASLEEMFNPDRLKETHIPGGFRPLGTDARAIPGHTFGLNLKPEERQELIAFLKTL
jgi:Cytochrome c